MNHAPRILAVVLLSGAFASVAEAAVVRGSGTFEVTFFGDEGQGVFDPPLVGPGSFTVRSLPYDPNVVDEDPSPPIDFDVLDFFFSFAGQTWDESDVPICQCDFTADGEPLGEHQAGHLFAQLGDHAPLGLQGLPGARDDEQSCLQSRGCLPRYGLGAPVHAAGGCRVTFERCPREDGQDAVRDFQ